MRFFITALLLSCASVCAQEVFPDIGSLPPIPYLPDPFLMANGERIKSPSDWRAQRQYLLDMLGYYEYGRMPPGPGNVKGTVTSASVSADKRTVTQKVRITCGPKDAVQFTFSLERPNSAGPFPAIIAIGGSFAADLGIDSALAHGARKGYLMVSFDEESLARDNLDMKTEIPAYAAYDWGTLAAWAWGTHRILDYLIGRPEADPKRIAVTGHSRYGKAAIWAGATDERFTLVAANHSGTGGAESGKFGKGETVLNVATRFNHWFQADGRYAQCGDSANITRMPFDGHFLKAAVAPRDLLDLEGTQDPIVNAWGSAQTTFAATRVYDYLGAEGRLVNHYCACKHVFDWDGIFAYTDHVWFGNALPSDYFKLNAGYSEEAALIPWSAPSAVSTRIVPERRSIRFYRSPRGYDFAGRRTPAYSGFSQAAKAQAGQGVGPESSR